MSIAGLSEIKIANREMSRDQAPPHGEVAGEEVAGEVGPALSRRRLPALADLVEPA